MTLQHILGECRMGKVGAEDAIAAAYELGIEIGKDKPIETTLDMDDVCQNLQAAVDKLAKENEYLRKAIGMLGRVIEEG